MLAEGETSVASLSGQMGIPKPSATSHPPPVRHCAHGNSLVLTPSAPSLLYHGLSLSDNQVPPVALLVVVSVMENSYRPYTATAAAAITTSFAISPTRGDPPVRERTERRSNKGLSRSGYGFSIDGSQEWYSSSSPESAFQFLQPALSLRPHEILQFPYIFPVDSAAPCASSACPFGIAGNGVESGARTQWELQSMTKAARIKRKMARQKNFRMSRDSSAASSGGSSTSGVCGNACNAAAHAQDSSSSLSSRMKDLYSFSTPDKKKLRVLFDKELKSSDVGSLRRIVLPKREAEGNLLRLSAKEGIQVVIRDVYSNKEWSMRYRFWMNNKSRMYVLENTGEFVKQKGLETGDYMTLYEDEDKNLYVSIKKVESPAAEPANAPSNTNINYPHTPFTTASTHKEQEVTFPTTKELTPRDDPEREANCHVTLPMGSASPRAKCEEAGNGLSDNVTGDSTRTQPTILAATEPCMASSQLGKSVPRARDCQQEDVDDCFSDLGSLPSARRHNYSLFDRLTDDLPDAQYWLTRRWSMV